MADRRPRGKSDVTEDDDSSGIGAARAREDDSGAETNGFAIASIFFSIVWLFGLGSILGMFLGYRAIGEIRDSAGEQGGRTLAVAAIWIGVAGLGSTALMVYFGIYAAGDGNG